jgi:uncharacterized Rossmann fold enzyme
MKYILDFDKTLFDTPACYAHIADTKNHNFEFTPELWEEFSSCEFLYNDVLDWVTSKDKEDLYILTAITPEQSGQATEYQKAKLLCSKLTELVTDTVFMVGAKGEYVRDIIGKFPAEESVVFVDDKIEQCLSVKEVCPEIICCLMVRDKDVIGDVKEVQNIKVVYSLSDVDVIIRDV